MSAKKSRRVVGEVTVSRSSRRYYSTSCTYESHSWTHSKDC